jgi:hypothetical protein
MRETKNSGWDDFGGFRCGEGIDHGRPHTGGGARQFLTPKNHTNYLNCLEFHCPLSFLVLFDV